MDKTIDKHALGVSGADCSTSISDFFRPYETRLTDLHVLRSADSTDPEIVIIIPFASPTKVTGVTVIPGGGIRSPHKLRLFANISLGDFSAVHDRAPTQEIELVGDDFCGAVLYPLRVSKFSNLHSLVLHFPAEVGPIDVYWLGLKGVASGVKRQAVVTVYETRANLADHDPLIDTFKSGHIGF